MPPEVLLDANLRLAETPDFELSDTDRLGLFVVSRLAQRQNVRVSLQKSPYGGTTAVVFIPAALLTEAPDTHGTGFRLDRRAERAIGSGRGADAGRKAEGTAPSGGDRRANGRSAVLSPVPTGLTGPAVLDGPVELEAPIGPLDLAGDPLDRASDPALDPALGPVLDGVSDLEDTESERGGIFRARDLRREDGRDPFHDDGSRGTRHGDGRGPRRKHEDREGRGPNRKDDDRDGRGADREDEAWDARRDQHQQARDHDGEGRKAEVRPMRPKSPVPLPRRTPPTLVTDRGRRVDDRAPDAPADEPPTTAPRTPTGPVAHTTPWAARAARRNPVPLIAPEPPQTPEPPRTTTEAGRDTAPTPWAACPGGSGRPASPPAP